MAEKQKSNYQKIAKLIKICQKNGIKHIKFEEIELEFFEPFQESKTSVKKVSKPKEEEKQQENEEKLDLIDFTKENELNYDMNLLFASAKATI